MSGRDASIYVNIMAGLSMVRNIRAFPVLFVGLVVGSVAIRGFGYVADIARGGCCPAF